uniref:Uncharacterized protein n=1 Tax=Nelumbo nucifera TaxID=4432 RepID=A0A822ZAM0_NELNU|nr:TPA_asm: hypothetical protein HUJ06_012890 [Nelumbo nucifera]
MKIYSIILGRNSKKSTVDVYLASLGGGMNISCIFYDFQRRCVALKVVGKNGCFVEGILHLPSNSPVKKLYLLLIVYSILRGSLLPHPSPSAFSSATHLPFAWVALPPPLHHSSKKGWG